MLVGFPIAFYVATLAGYAAYAATGDRFWFQLGIVANVAGVVGAALATIPGFIDWAFGIPDGHRAKMVGLEHMLLNVGALVLFTVDAIVQGSQWNAASPRYFLALALAAAGMGLTLAAGFLGWEMIQKHHVGIDLTPEQHRIDIVASGRPIRNDHSATLRN